MRTIQTSSVWYTLGYRFGIAAPLSDTAFLLYRTEKEARKQAHRRRRVGEDCEAVQPVVKD